MSWRCLLLMLHCTSTTNVCLQLALQDRTSGLRCHSEHDLFVVNRRCQQADQAILIAYRTTYATYGQVQPRTATWPPYASVSLWVGSPSQQLQLPSVLLSVSKVTFLSSIASHLGMQTVHSLIHA